MVLNDITNDYLQFTTELDSHKYKDSFLSSALVIINEYQSKLYHYADVFLKSSKGTNERSDLIENLGKLETSFSIQIANMNTALRDTAKLVSNIQNMDFTSSSVEENAEEMCNILNEIMDTIEVYAANKIRGMSNKEVFFLLISKLQEFKEIYERIYNNYSILINAEEELLEELPEDVVNAEEIYYLDVRSTRPDSDPSSFSDDLKLLTECLQGLERLLAPEENHTIYIRKIESGSLKALFASDKINFSIFPDLITSISNAMKTWRLTPAEKEKMQAETAKIKAETELITAQAEAQRIQNEGSKMAIVNSQIDFLCEKLNLKADNPDCVEQIQKFCLPLVTYIEHNPVGTINDVKYDISKEIHLLEDSDH